MNVIGDYVVVRKIKTKNREFAGLEMTEHQDTEMKYLVGEVIGVGSLVDWVKKGDTVKFSKSAGHLDEIDGVEYHIVNCSIRKNDIAYIL